jgi:hypothetical protein
MLNRRAIIGQLPALFIGTFLVAVLLVGFLFLSGTVKSLEGAHNGEKIYKEGEIGAGDIRIAMKNHERFVDAKLRIRNGESIDAALVAEEYGKEPVVIDEADDINIEYTVAGIWVVLYG